MSQHKKFENQVAIVTGAGRGLGAETAMELARHGATIVVNDISKENAQKVAATIGELGVPVLTSNHDISDHKQTQEMVTEVLDKFAKIDIVVNNAGITRDSMFHKMAESQWDSVMSVNLKGTFNVSQACARPMMEAGCGVIINISSIAADGNIGQTNYSASKAGVIGFTKSLALEMARSGVRVNAIAPGFIQTEMTDAIPTEVIEKFKKNIPLGRMGAPKDIANMVCFLASENSSYITGQCFSVNGGLGVGL